PDLPLLPAPARLARGGRGRRPEHVPERLPRPSARRRARARVGLALQDRAQRLPLAPPLLLAARPHRVADRLRRRRGADACAGAAAPAHRPHAVPVQPKTVAPLRRAPASARPELGRVAPAVAATATTSVAAVAPTHRARKPALAPGRAKKLARAAAAVAAG